MEKYPTDIRPSRDRWGTPGRESLPVLRFWQMTFILAIWSQSEFGHHMSESHILDEWIWLEWISEWISWIPESRESLNLVNLAVNLVNLSWLRKINSYLVPPGQNNYYLSISIVTSRKQFQCQNIRHCTVETALEMLFHNLLEWI